MLSQKATIVVDLGFGDSGKGTVVDYLARTSHVSAVIRFNGDIATNECGLAYRVITQ